MAIWDRLTAGIAGLGIGAAAEDAISPVLETTKQRARGERAVRVVDPTTAAAAAAREFDNGDVFESLGPNGNVIGRSTWGQSTVDFADDAKRTGVGQARFNLLRRLGQTMPPYPEALKLWRRGRINEATIDTILRREAIPEGLRPALKELFDERLPVADVANAIQQGFLPDPPASHPGDPVLPAPTPPDPNWQHVDGPFQIPKEVVGIDSAHEAKSDGFDYERLRVLAELVGLPPGEETLLDMWRRGIIGANGYAQGLKEGHTKTKWTAALSARFYQLLPPGVLVRLRLKGWIEDQPYKDRMALHGYRDTQAEDWWLSEGRPATMRQTLIGLRRGGVYDAKPEATPEPFRAAVLQSDISNHWANLLYAGRETYPSLFAIRGLLQAGVWDAAKGEDIIYKAGYPRDMAHDIATHFAVSGGATTDPHVGKAQTQLWTTTHRSYIASESDDTIARARLTDLGIPGAEQDQIVALWQAERDLIRRQLTPTDVKKAYLNMTHNYATGANWTRDDAFNALVARGFSPIEANDYLDIPLKG